MVGCSGVTLAFAGGLLPLQVPQRPIHAHLNFLTTRIMSVSRMLKIMDVTIGK